MDRLDCSGHLALKEPARDTQKQENIEKGGNDSIDEMVCLIQHMRHRAVAKDLSGTLMRSWRLPICGLQYPWPPSFLQHEDISCVTGWQLGNRAQRRMFPQSVDHHPHESKANMIFLNLYFFSILEEVRWISFQESNLALYIKKLSKVSPCEPVISLLGINPGEIIQNEVKTQEMFFTVNNEKLLAISITIRGMTK